MGELAPGHPARLEPEAPNFDMAATDLLTDARNALRTLWAPDRAFAALAARPRVAAALAICTAAALVAAAVTVPRTDFGDGLDPAAEQQGAGGAAPEPTEYERAQAHETAGKVGALRTWAAAALGPTVTALGVALALVLAFWVAGAPVSYRPTLAVVSHAALPLALRALLGAPVALFLGRFPASEAGALLRSSAAGLLPAAAPPLHAALGALDLFTLWTLALTALGMARLSGASRARSALATALPWAGLVVLTMALAAFTSAPPAQH
jgi:hypothetical protein